ncbi:MAG: hypothetical protein Q8R29_03625 [bacterium]|nr:hypothetical protein [bacterium]
MISTTHIAIAAAASKTLSQGNPLAAFFISWASHYLADAIPHWQYKLKVSKKWSNDPGDLEKIRKSSLPLTDYVAVALDSFIGALVIFLISPHGSLKDWLYILAVVAGGPFPDFLLFLHKRFSWRILEVLRKFHDSFHSGINLSPYPKLGIPFQIIIVLIALWIAI